MAGRPPKLTPMQENKLRERLRKGERATDLAKEYGISASTISVKFSKKTRIARVTAEQMLEAEEAMLRLPGEVQAEAYSILDQLREISRHLAGAARLGAATAHRLQAVANHQSKQVDLSKPLDGESGEALRSIAALSKVANDAAQGGHILVAANKEAQRAPAPSKISFAWVDGAVSSGS